MEIFKAPLSDNSDCNTRKHNYCHQSNVFHEGLYKKTILYKHLAILSLVANFKEEVVKNTIKERE